MAQGKYRKLTVFLEDREGKVTYSPTETSPPILAEKISDMGFPTKVKMVHPVRGDNCDDAIINVGGMTCMSCVKSIQDHISEVSGVHGINVSLEKNQAYVQFNRSRITAEKIAEAIDDMGFEASVHSITRQKDLITHITVEGMTCQSCVKNIETNIGSMAGVKEIRVSLADKEAFVIYNPAQTNPQVLRDHIDDMGFEAKLTRQSSIESEFDRLASRQSSSRSISNDKVCEISIKGMTCNSCVKNIETNISGKPGIKFISVFLEKEMGTVTFNPSVTTPAAIAEMIDDMGFEAIAMSGETEKSTDTVIINIEGMTCNSCVKNIEENISKNPAVKSIDVSLADKNGTIQYYPNKITPKQLKDAIDDMGFEASLPGTQSNREGEGSSQKPQSSKVNDVKVDIEKGAVTFRKSVEVAEDDYDKCFLKVTGMTCASCVATIEKNVMKLEGIKYCLVALMSQKAEVKYDGAVILPSTIANKISSLGFDATVIEDEANGQGTVELLVTGMTCSSCIHLIESTLLKKPGILTASVALSTCKGRFTFDPEITGPRDIIEIIKSLGFDAALFTDDDKKAARYDHRHQIKRWRTSFLWSLLFGVPSMAIMMYFMFAKPPNDHISHGNISSNYTTPKPKMSSDGHYQIIIIPGLSLDNLLMFILATPVQV